MNPLAIEEFDTSVLEPMLGEENEVYFEYLTPTPEDIAEFFSNPYNEMSI